jgi:hypothetical protein
MVPNEPATFYTGDYTFLKADAEKLRVDSGNANTSFLSSDVPYIGSTTASPYYLQAKYISSTGAINALAYTTTAGGTLYPGCSATIG